MIVGDVHGDLVRLLEALEPYPADRWRTVFVGDLIDGGPLGVDALRYARDRPNATVVLGNHEALTLAALGARASRGPALTIWLQVGGHPHDLEALASAPDLVEWMRGLPGLVRLEDGTVVQHADNDNYWDLLTDPDRDPVAQVNAGVRRMLTSGEEEQVWDLLLPRRVFQLQPLRLERWLGRLAAPRMVHGHTPHGRREPDAYADGRVINYDGRLSRWGPGGSGETSPLPASVGALPGLRG